jgi:DNA-directed RNA polymerase subunit RPC12/RpoP
MQTRKTKVRCARCPQIWEVPGMVNKKTKKDLTCPNCGYILPAVLARYLYETARHVDSAAEHVLLDEGTIRKTRDKDALARFKGIKSAKGYQ